jgi:O-antigen ligase
MRTQHVRDWLMPLLVVAFVGGSVTFLTPIFNLVTRWVVLLTVVAYIVLKGKATLPLRSTVGWLTLAVTLWAASTTAWSEVPDLSIMKSIAFGLVAFCGLAFGEFWEGQRPARRCLEFLYPVCGVALLAAFGGVASPSAVVASGSYGLYQGAVEGPNMFGMLMTMSMPIALWHVYEHWNQPRQRGVGLAACAVLLFFLVSSGSRAAMLAAICVLAGFLVTMQVRTKLRISLLIGVLCTGAYLSAPTQVIGFVEALVYKQANSDEGLYYSRKSNWEESLDAAEAGGWVGVGYGVSVGESGFSGGFSAVGYGREKGNSQLGIVEETGIFGLLIYCCLLLTLFARLISRIRMLPSGPDRVLTGIVTGTLAGLVVQSLFEAWWSAPASPESMYFWTMAGVALSFRVVRAPAGAPADLPNRAAPRAQPWTR